MKMSFFTFFNSAISEKNGDIYIFKKEHVIYEIA